jgi:hypothetical protein
MRALDVLTLAAVALVVLLVSLPRLQDLAVRENESDARWLAGRLGELGQRPGTPPGDIRALLEAQPALARLLDDAEYLEGGRLLRRHGYLFELVAEPSSLGGCAVQAVRAWPWRFERTGRTAYLWRCGEPLRAHENPGGLWSGLGGAPQVVTLADGWRSLSR